MTLPEHEYANAERKRREDEIWNAAIEAAAEVANDYDNLELEEVILFLKRPTS